MLLESDESESGDNVEFDEDNDDIDADPDYISDDRIEIDPDLVIDSPIQEIECIKEEALTHTNAEINRKKIDYANITDGSLNNLNYDELNALFGILILSAALKDNHLSTKVMFDVTFSSGRYIYTDKLHVNSLKEALELYTLATKYEIRELKEKCASYFLSNVTLDNLFIEYEYSLNENIKELLDSCRNFVCNETKAVLESPHFKDASRIVIEDIIKQDSLNVNSELDVINAVLKWARSECRRRSLSCDEMYLRDCIEPLLKHLRLLSLTPEEFCDFVEQHNIFTSLESSVLTRKLLQPDSKVRVPETFCFIAEKRKPKPIPLVRQESGSKEKEMGTSQLGIHQPSPKNGKITLLNTFGDQAFRAGRQMNHHVLNTYPDKYGTYEKEDKAVNKSIESGTHQFHRNNKIRHSHNFEDQTSRITQEMKNQQTLNTHVSFLTKQKRMYDFPLSDVQNHIGSAFSTDVKCSARIRIVEGRILLHGIHLKLKNTKAEVDELEAHVCFSGFLEEPETHVYKEEIKNDIFSITLSEPKVLQQKKMESGQESIKEKMKAVQEKIEAGQEYAKEEMKVVQEKIEAGQEDMKREISAIIESKFEAMDIRIYTVEN
ncbi:BTB/POZ domain-containing protein 6-A, partial [Stegodyphus mimosarum]